MDFFLDRNVPEKLARMLGYYDRNHTVVFHDDRFKPTTPDVEWLQDIANWKPIPVVVSGDGRILRNPAELQVLSDLPITFFLFADAWCNLPWHDRAWKTIKVWPDVIKASSPHRPSIYKIPISASKIDLVGYTADIGPRSKRPRR